MVTASTLDPQQITSPRCETLYRAFACDQQLIFGGKTVYITKDLLLTREEGTTVRDLTVIRGSPTDVLADEYSCQIDDEGRTMFYRTRWEMFDNEKGCWVPCEDPRPMPVMKN